MNTGAEQGEGGVGAASLTLKNCIFYITIDNVNNH